MELNLNLDEHIILFDNVSEYYYKGFTKVELNGKSNYIDYYGKTVSDTFYDEISITYYDNHNLGTLFLVSNNGKYGYINEKGETIVELIYDKLNSLSSANTCVYNRGNIYGLLSIVGDSFVEKPFGELKINNIVTDNTNYLIVEKDNKYGVIDLYNNIILDVVYDKINSYDKYNDLFYVIRDRKTNFINNRGEIINGEHRISNITKTGYYIVEKDDKYGVTDINGNILINIVYNNLLLNYGDTFLFCDEKNKYGIVNIKGEHIIDSLDYIIDFYVTKTKYIIIRKDNLYGIMNRKGEFIIKPKYSYIENISDEIELYKISDKSGKHTIINLK